MDKLYPLTFKTIFKEKIWGGDKIRKVLQKDFSPLPNCGETWEVSAVPENESIVKNGPFAGRGLRELIAEYEERLVGKKVFESFGAEFPLLIKFIDANDDLSIQVHPDDEQALERHNSRGKTEMWYIIQADPHAKLIAGFKKNVRREEYLEHLEAGSLDSILNYEPVYADDVFYMPAGRVHSIGKGVLLAEIQETSDITYRIYDFDRKDSRGNARELHTDLSLDIIDFNYHEHYKTFYKDQRNSPVNLARSQFFITDKLWLDQKEIISLDYDSFTVLINLGGKVLIDGEYELNMGDVYLIPAEYRNLTLSPEGESKILQVHL